MTVTMSANRILGKVSLATLLVRLGDHKRIYNSHRKKEGKKILHAFHRKMLALKSLVSKNSML